LDECRYRAKSDRCWVENFRNRTMTCTQERARSWLDASSQQAARAYAKADALLMTMTAGELTSW
jgi:hypothetical protein